MDENIMNNEVEEMEINDVEVLDEIPEDTADYEAASCDCREIDGLTAIAALAISAGVGFVAGKIVSSEPAKKLGGKIKGGFKKFGDKITGKNKKPAEIAESSEEKPEEKPAETPVEEPKVEEATTEPAAQEATPAKKTTKK